MRFAVTADYSTIIDTATGYHVAEGPYFRTGEWMGYPDPLVSAGILNGRDFDGPEWTETKRGTFTALSDGFTLKITKRGANWVAYRDGAPLVDARFKRLYEWSGLSDAQREVPGIAILARRNWFNPETADPDGMGAWKWRGAGPDFAGKPPRLWWATIEPGAEDVVHYMANWPVTDADEKAIFARADLFGWRHRVGTLLARFALTPTEELATALHEMQRAAKDRNLPFADAIQHTGAVRLGHASPETSVRKRGHLSDDAPFMVCDFFDAPRTELTPLTEARSRAARAVEAYIEMIEERRNG